MPVEIKELVIRMIAREGGGAEAGQPAQNGSEAPGNADPDVMVQLCVRQVLAILEKKKKR